MIIYFVWAIILTVHRGTVIASKDEEHAKEFAAYDGSREETFNPTLNAAGVEFHGDQEQL
jgi:hypothetical protein